jgi:ribosome-associated toxin RatA of RatAB toxin-antitoxin module
MLHSDAAGLDRDGTAMHWTRQITSFGEPETVYGLLADFERCPRLLPHVRETRVVEANRQRGSEFVRIGYERFGVFVPCTCLVTRDLAARRLDLLHIQGHAAGLRETWLAASSEDGGTHLEYGFTDAHRSSIATRLAAAVLVTPLADRTMEMIDLLAEADRLARGGLAPSSAHRNGGF